MSEVFRRVVTEEGFVVAELRALDAGIAAYRDALNGAAPQTKSAAIVSGPDRQ